MMSCRSLPNLWKLQKIVSNQRSGTACAVFCAQSNNITTQCNQNVDSKTPLTRIPYSKARHGEFLQEPPKLMNSYLGDAPLRSYLKRHLPDEIQNSIEDDLVRFGQRSATDIHALGLDCEKQPPYLIQQNSWGKRVDELWTCDAWKQMHDISAEEGLIAIGYERKYEEYSRLYQMTKLYLYAPSSGLYSCPLAMTDGAAKTFELLLGNKNLDSLSLTRFKEVYGHLISRNPSEFWSSGQWMTERRGGSDVANGTETIAVLQSDGSYKLYGYKWFTSALDSNMALTLARICNENGETITGTSGLTLFFLETNQPNGVRNNIQVVRLKDKLGTRQLPTAELLLDGTIAHKISKDGRGVAEISTMLSLTRLHNSCAAVSGMRRGLSLARDYAHKRVAFGKPIAQYPLHVQTLARMEVEVRGALALFMDVAKLLGRLDCGKATDEEKLLFRILTPILKLYTAKQAMSVSSETVEAFGGQGYMEDSGIPILFRDAQVLPIWEGTTNILSLDVLRSIAKTQGQVLHALSSNVLARVSIVKNSALDQSKQKVLKSVQEIGSFVMEHSDELVPAARDLSYSIAKTYIGTLLLENASHAEATKQDVLSAQRWCMGQDLTIVSTNYKLGLYKNDQLDYDFAIVMDGYNSDI